MTYKLLGINFATSNKVGEIGRGKRIRVSISPSNGDLFLQELDRALANWKRNQGIR